MEDGDIQFTFTAQTEKTTAARYGLVSADTITDNYLLSHGWNREDNWLLYCKKRGSFPVPSEPESTLCGSTQVKQFAFHFEAFLLHNTDDIIVHNNQRIMRIISGWLRWLTRCFTAMNTNTVVYFKSAPDVY